MSSGPQAGVYALLPDGSQALVHAWIGEDYELADLPEFLDAGRWEGEVLLLTAREVQNLKLRAEAESFDHEEGLIALCRDLDAFRRARTLDGLRLVEMG
ncbi:hypothetical protein [Aquibaculum sediminis]|uniref:hypothetical protein n=1 Tax=Aquibaculum sediminis TaxID=3231907 RepID=UPI003453A448